MNGMIRDLKIGSTVKTNEMRYDTIPIDWILVHKSSHRDIYPENSVLLMSKYILTIKAFDPKVKDRRNHTDAECNFGSNDYSESSIRKWLNTKGECYWEDSSKKSSPAVPEVAYNPYVTEMGFLTAFSNKAIYTIIPVPVNTMVSDKAHVITGDRIFIPSEKEVGLRGGSKIEGRTFDYFKKIRGRRLLRKAYPLDKAIERTSWSFREDYPDCTEFMPWMYMLRSIDTETKLKGCRVSGIDKDGTRFTSFAFNGTIGVRPVICIPADTEIEYNESSICYNLIL